MAKGIELPVNVLILVAIGVIVLIGLVVLLGVGIGGVSPAIVELEKSKACGELVNTYKCDVDPTTISVNGKSLNGNDNLQKLCNEFKGCKNAVGKETDCCKINVCGCSGTPVTLPVKP